MQEMDAPPPREGDALGLTRRDVVPVLDGDVLRDLELVDGLEDGEALPDRVHADVLERGMIEVDEDVARDAVLCGRGPGQHWRGSNGAAEERAHR